MRAIRIAFSILIHNLDHNATSSTFPSYVTPLLSTARLPVTSRRSILSFLIMVQRGLGPLATETGLVKVRFGGYKRRYFVSLVHALDYLSDRRRERY